MNATETLPDAAFVRPSFPKSSTDVPPMFSESSPFVPPESPQSSPDEQRDSKGRFTEGNVGGPGNPFARQVAMLRKVLLNCVTEEDMAAIGNKLIDMAKNGNIQAIKLLFSYTLGKPVEGVQPDQLDMQEWELFKQLAQIPLEADKVAMVPDQSVALNTARVMRPALAQAMSQNLLKDITSDRDEALRQEERQKQNRILRELRRAERQKAGKPVCGKGQGAPAPKKGSGAPSVANGSTGPLTNGEMSPNGDRAPNGRPSANGKTEPATGFGPSTNGFFGDGGPVDGPVTMP